MHTVDGFALPIGRNRIAAVNVFLFPKSIYHKKRGFKHAEGLYAPLPTHIGGEIESELSPPLLIP